MKNIDEMTNVEIDLAIAEIEGLRLKFMGTGKVPMLGRMIYSPTTDWSQCGPLIEKYVIHIEWITASNMWCAIIGKVLYGGWDKSLPIAICKAIVRADRYKKENK